MLRRISFYLSWLLWSLFIVMLVFPWHDLQNHTHWGKVAWIPFASGPLKASDIIGNVLLYVPFGFLGARATQHRLTLWLVLAAAAVLSFSTEATQLFSHHRFPSATDFTCNVIGCSVGLYFAQLAPRTALGLPQEIRS